MAAVLVPVIFGWVQIYIAVVIGAAFMVLTKCLTMDEAYRYIEWKAVFLIAGMLPLGVALDTQWRSLTRCGKCYLAAWSIRTLWRFVWSLDHNFYCHQHHSHSCSGCLDGAHCLEDVSRSGNFTLSADDGDSYGRLLEFYLAYISSGQCAGYGTGRL